MATTLYVKFKRKDAFHSKAYSKINTTIACVAECLCKSEKSRKPAVLNNRKNKGTVYRERTIYLFIPFPCFFFLFFFFFLAQFLAFFFLLSHKTTSYAGYNHNAITTKYWCLTIFQVTYLSREDS